MNSQLNLNDLDAYNSKKNNKGLGISINNEVNVNTEASNKVFLNNIEGLNHLDEVLIMNNNDSHHQNTINRRLSKENNNPKDTQANNDKSKYINSKFKDKLNNKVLDIELINLDQISPNFKNIKEFKNSNNSIEKNSIVKEDNENNKNNKNNEIEDINSFKKLNFNSDNSNNSNSRNLEKNENMEGNKNGNEQNLKKENSKNKFDVEVININESNINVNSNSNDIVDVTTKRKYDMESDITGRKLQNNKIIRVNSIKSGNNIVQDIIKNDHEKLCRVCLEGYIESTDQLIAPCKCIGSIKFIHLECLKKSLESMMKTKCEICNEPYYFKLIFKKKYTNKRICDAVEVALISSLIYVVIIYAIIMMIYFIIVNVKDDLIASTKKKILIACLIPASVISLFAIIYSFSIRKYFLLNFETWNISSYDEFNLCKESENNVLTLISKSPMFDKEHISYSLDNQWRNLITNVPDNVVLMFEE